MFIVVHCCTQKHIICSTSRHACTLHMLAHSDTEEWSDGAKNMVNVAGWNGMECNAKNQLQIESRIDINFAIIEKCRYCWWALLEFSFAMQISWTNYFYLDSASLVISIISIHIDKFISMINTRHECDLYYLTNVLNSKWISFWSFVFHRIGFICCCKLSQSPHSLLCLFSFCFLPPAYYTHPFIRSRSTKSHATLLSIYRRDFAENCYAILPFCPIFCCECFPWYILIDIVMV